MQQYEEQSDAFVTDHSKALILIAGHPGERIFLSCDNHTSNTGIYTEPSLSGSNYKDYCT